jgi:hypothetical protein
MGIPAEFYNNIGNSYRQVMISLEIKLCEANDNDKEYKLICEFSRKYMMPWQLWEKLLRGTNYSNTKDDFPKLLSFYPTCYHQKNGLHYIKKHLKQMKDFNEQPENVQSEYYYANKDTIFPNCISSLVQALKYPHSDLEKIWNIYRKNACSPPPEELKATFLKMVALHDRMKNSEDKDSDIFEAESEKFIQFNVEKNLGEDLSNKKLWKLYINYLKSKTDKTLLLQTYSTYCRLFLDDVEMKEEYKKVSEEFGPSKVLWENMFDFEEKKNDSEVAFLMPDDIDDLNILEDAFDFKTPFPGIHFSFDGILQQKFPFHQNFMLYIRENTTPKIQQKLYNTCKYFFAKSPYPICYKLSLEDIEEDETAERIVQQSLQVKYNEERDTLQIENLWISDVVFIGRNNPFESMFIEDYITRIYRCDAKYVDIRTELLYMNELKFFIGHGNVESLYLANESIFLDVDDGSEVILEDIVKMVPKIKFLDVSSPMLTPTTFSTIKSLTFENKIQSFMLSKIKTELESEAFAEFVTANFASGGKIELFFEINRTLVLKFKQILQTAINNHWNVMEDRPQLFIGQGNGGIYSSI